MITVSQAFKDALKLGVRNYYIGVQVWRNTPGSPAIDITDRVLSSNINHDFEQRSGRLSLELDNYDYALSPMKVDSPMNQVSSVYDPLLDARHEIRVYEGILTSGGSYEYITRFTGVLGDEIDSETLPGIVSLTARDFSKYLQDIYIFQSKTYMSLVVENVIQDMLNTFVPGLGFTVNTLTPTNFMIGRPDKPYTAKDTNLWSAIQSLADAAGHELRFIEDGSLVLRRVVQDFSSVTPVATFNENDLIRDKISVSDADIRNHIVLKVEGLTPIEKKNQASIDKYGPRYMEVNRSMSNIITTLEQGHRLVDDLLNDLSNMEPIDTLEMPLYPILQVGDVVSVSNAKLGTNGQNIKFKVTRIQDSYSADKKRTNVYLQGRTLVPATASLATNPVTGLTYQMMNREIQNYPGSGWSGNTKKTYFPMVMWTPPATYTDGSAVENDFGGYTIYRKLSGQTTWVPVSSVKSYIAALDLKVSYFYDYTVQPGNWDYKIVAVNKYGKVAADSAILTLSVPNTSYT